MRDQVFDVAVVVRQESSELVPLRECDPDASDAEISQLGFARVGPHSEIRANLTKLSHLAVAARSSGQTDRRRADRAKIGRVVHDLA